MLRTLAILLLLAQSPTTLIQQAQDLLSEALRQLNPPPAAVIVPVDADLRTFVAAAAPGAVLVVPANVTYRGTIDITKPVTLVTSGVLPDRRITPADASQLSKVQALPGGEPAIRIASGIQGVIIRGIEVLPNPCFCNNTIEDDGNGTVFDRDYIHGDPANGSKNGIVLGGSNTVITRSHISDFKSTGQETHAINGYNGTGPYSVVDNYIEAAGVNIMFGGSDPSVAGLVPSDIMIRDNDIVKPAAWRSQAWVVKNLFELKNARRVTFENNRLDGSWTSGQTGYGILLTVRNQDGNCPWCLVEDVVIRRNTITNVGAGFQILGTDYTYPSGILQRVQIEDNALAIDGSYGAGRSFTLIAAPRDLSITRNAITGINMQTAITFAGSDRRPVVGLHVLGNTFPEGEYGIHGDDAPGLGKAAVDFYTDGIYEWADNIIVRGPSGRYIIYPAGTTVID